MDPGLAAPFLAKAVQVRHEHIRLLDETFNNGVQVV